MPVKPAVLIAIDRGICRLAEHLLDHADLELIALHDKSAYALAERGIAVRAFSSFLPDLACERIIDDAARRAKAVAGAVSGNVFWRDWSQHDHEILHELTQATVECMRTSFFESMRLIQTLRWCVNKSDLRLLMTPHDICLETRTLVNAAHRYRIPSLHVCHGFPYGGINSITLREPCASDAVAVHSERLRQLYTRLGFAPDRVVVTGSPDWDVYARPPVVGHRENVCEVLGLDPSRPIIVYCLTYIDRLSAVNVERGSYLRHVREDITSAFAGLSLRHPEWQFVLRPHPNDPDAPTDIAECAEGAGLKDYCVDDKTSPVSCLGIADVFICMHSNMGIEAVLAGKPVINYVPESHCAGVFDEGVGPLFAPDDAPMQVSRFEELLPAIEAALLDEVTRERFFTARPATIKKFNYCNDGQALRRICDLAFNMIEGRMAVPPAASFPELAPVLARAAQVDFASAVIVGPSASLMTEIFNPNADRSVTIAETAAEVAADVHDLIIFAAPLYADDDVGQLLQSAKEKLCSGGRIIAAFLNATSVGAVADEEADSWAPPRPDCAASSAVGQYTRDRLADLFAEAGLGVEGACAMLNERAGDRFVREEAFNSADAGDDADVDAWVLRLTWT